MLRDFVDLFSEASVAHLLAHDQPQFASSDHLGLVAGFQHRRCLQLECAAGFIVGIVLSGVDEPSNAYSVFNLTLRLVGILIYVP